MMSVALSIAGSDSGGGAGIQADIKTFWALGVFPTTAVTAVTAQNTLAVQDIHLVPPASVTAQIDAVFADLAPRAVKIGMLGQAATIAAVAQCLARHRPPALVLDPVMIATSGRRLLPAAATTALITQLLPQTLLLTPNLPEAAALSGLPLATSEAEIIAQATAILRLGVSAVLIKGGHDRGADSVDILVQPNGLTRFRAERLIVGDLHGGGCTLSSAIAAGLAKRHSLLDSIAAAKVFVSKAITAAARVQIGHGARPLLQPVPAGSDAGC